MVTGLVDTSILVDVLRKYPPAESWITSRTDLGVSQAVWLEILDGVINKQARNKAIGVLLQLTKLEVTVTDFDWAIDSLSQFKLSHNVGMMDCLIASTSQRLQVPLYTTNLKHFTPIIGSLAVKPY